MAKQYKNLNDFHIDKVLGLADWLSAHQYDFQMSKDANGDIEILNPSAVMFEDIFYDARTNRITFTEKATGKEQSALLIGTGGMGVLKQIAHFIHQLDKEYFADMNISANTRHLHALANENPRITIVE